MTRLFVLFYAGVVIVLIAAWYIHGEISNAQFGSEIPRVTEGAHRGGMRLLARSLNDAAPEARQRVVDQYQGRFRLQVVLTPLDQFRGETRSRLEQTGEVVYSEGRVCTLLDDRQTVVQLGGFPQFTHFERALRGGMRLAVDTVSEADHDERENVVTQLTDEFGYPVQLVSRDDLPPTVSKRADYGGDVMFYVHDDVAFVAAPLPDQSAFLNFGPLPNFENAERRALTTTTAVVLVLAALAIAVLLRPVARQLRHVEDAAAAIAAGDLSARVDEARAPSTRPLAQAFNNMADRTETLLRTQSELLQAVSHELRTPLSRIRFAIDLIESAKTDDERKKRLEALDIASDDLNDLVGELLKYVRLETSDSGQHREPVLLHEAIETQVSRNAAMHPDVRFEQADNPAELTVEADPAAFQRVVGNLLSNAGRFAREQVSITSARQNGCVVVDVDDDGPGIPESDRERVFSPFTRLDNNADSASDEKSETSPGVGLGLAIVKRIVTQHGGTIEVQRSPAGGCRIRSTWPVTSRLP